MKNILRKKVAIITQYFPPDMAGTGRVMRELAEDLQEYGYDVEVFAGRTRYFNKQTYAHAPTRVPVRRVRHIRFGRGNTPSRLFSFLSFPLMLLIRLPAFKKAHAVIMVSNPPTIVAVGAFIHILLGKKVYYILQDIYPEIAIALGAASRQSLFTRAMRSVNVWGFRHMEKIIVLSRAMQSHLKKAYELPEEKTVVISNWADTNYIYPASKDNPWSRVAGFAHAFVVLYAGNVGLAYDFMPVLGAALRLRDDTDIVFLFIGEGGNKKRLERAARERGLRNVEFASYVADEDYNALLASADCHLVIHRPEMNAYCLPGKVYSAMASGRPVLALTEEESELANIVASSHGGIVTEDARTLARAVKTLKADEEARRRLGEAGRTYIEKHFSRRALTKKYAEALHLF